MSFHDYNSSITFKGDKSVLVDIEALVDDGEIFESIADSYDEVDNHDVNMLTYRLTTSNGNSINIYDLHNLVNEKAEIIYVITDSATFIDIISTSSSYDTHIESDPERIHELCDMYGLDFFEVEEEEFDYDDNDEYDDY